MGSEHLPVISQNDQENRDRFWTATRSRFSVHPTVDKETKLLEANTRKNRGAFTRRLPPLESKIFPTKASPDSGFSDLILVDSNYPKPRLPGSIEEFSASPAKDVPSSYTKVSENEIDSTAPAKDARLTHVKASENLLDRASAAKDVPSSNTKAPENEISSTAPTKDARLTHVKASENLLDKASPTKDAQLNHDKASENSVDLGLDRLHTPPQRLYQLHGQSSASQKKAERRIGYQTISQPKLQAQTQPKVKAEVEDWSQKDASSSDTFLDKDKTSEVTKTPNMHFTDRPKVSPKEMMYNPSAEKQPLRLRPQFEKATIKSELQVLNAPNESELPVVKVTEKSELPVVKATEKSAAQVKSLKTSTIKKEPKTKKPVKEVLSAEKLVKIVPMRSKSLRPKPSAPVAKASGPKVAEKAAVRRLKKSPHSMRRAQEKLLPVRGRKAPIRQMPGRKRMEVKVDSRVKRAPATQTLPLLQGRKNAATTRNHNNAANRSRKERMVFDIRGSLMLRHDRPPPPPPPKRPLRPPAPQDLRRRYLGRETPRRVRPGPPLSGPKPQLSHREAGQWRRVHRKFGVEPTTRRRVTRHDRYLGRVERIQLEAALRYNEALAEKERRRERSKWRQAAQLWKVRDRYREQQQERSRRQWVAPKKTRREVADRHKYGLPENELAPVLEAPERPRRGPIERFDFAERRRVNLQRYAAHLGLDRQSHQPWDSGDARMPRVRPARSPVEPRAASGRTEKRREAVPVMKEAKADLKKQDETLEISNAPRNRDQTSGDCENNERSRNRRIYQAYTLGQKPQNVTTGKRATIPLTTRTGFAAKITAKNAQKPRGQVDETKRQRNVKKQEEPLQLTKREKVLGSVTSLRTIDFLGDDPEPDTFDAFDKARIKYNIEIDSPLEEDNS